MKRLIVIGLLFLNVTLSVNAQEVKKTKKDYLVTINTTFGGIYLLLYDETPKHKENFIKLAQEGFFNGTSFHRIINNFMIQGGDPNSKDADPNNDGMGGPEYTIPAEFNPKFTHVQGALAAARMGDNVNPGKASNGSQFYIVEGKQGAHFLNNNYTVYGLVIKGIEVVEKIAEQPKDGRDRPLSDIKMTVTVKKMKKKKITKEFGYVFN